MSGTRYRIINVRNETWILSHRHVARLVIRRLVRRHRLPVPFATASLLPSLSSTQKASCYPSMSEHAMTTQKILTYGLNRSPIRAHFQNMPVRPSLFLSMTLGNMECTYVDVQMMSRMTSRRDWKLKMAVMMGEKLLGAGGLMFGTSWVAGWTCATARWVVF